MLGTLAVERADERFSRDCHLVSGPRSEVEPFFGMADKSSTVPARRRESAHIGVGDGISEIEACCQPAVTDAAGVTTSTCPLIAAGPARDRHPELDPNA